MTKFAFLRCFEMARTQKIKLSKSMIVVVSTIPGKHTRKKRTRFQMREM